MYELYDPCTTMFFFRNKHIMVDLGTGNNNKINWALDDKQEMIDLVEVRSLFLGFASVYNVSNLPYFFSMADCIPWCKKRKRFSGVTSRLFDKISILVVRIRKGNEAEDFIMKYITCTKKKKRFK